VSRSAAWPVLLAAAAVLVWVQLGGSPWAARAWTVILLVPLPALLIAEGRRLGELERLPRTQAYASSIASLWILAAVTLAAAWASGYGASELGLARDGDIGRVAILAAAATTAGIAILFGFRLAGVKEPAIVRELMPVTRPERVLFGVVSVSAGICEEIVYRGFLIHVLHGATGSIILAVIVSSGAFGVAHAYQQPAGALRAALLGLVLAVPLLTTGSILPAIAAHIAIDLLSGLWLARYLLR
jgi:membrane protease YdiL (CAAX protease family)